jgi:hypothetical protein
MRLGFLLEAYRRVEDGGNREPINGKRADNFESAIAEIQLLGTEEQVGMAKKLAHDIASGEVASSDLLLRSLRNDLREELGLNVIHEDPVHFRWQPKKA